MIQNKRFDVVERVRRVGKSLSAEMIFELLQQRIALLFRSDFYCHAAFVIGCRRRRGAKITARQSAQSG